MNREVRGALAGGGWKKAFSMPAPKKNLFCKSEFLYYSFYTGGLYIHQIEWCNYDNARNKITKSITLASFTTCIKQLCLSCFWIHYTHSFFSLCLLLYHQVVSVLYVIELIWHATTSVNNIMAINVLSCLIDHGNYVMVA